MKKTNLMARFVELDTVAFNRYSREIDRLGLFVPFLLIVSALLAPVVLYQSTTEEPTLEMFFTTHVFSIGFSAAAMVLFKAYVEAKNRLDTLDQKHGFNKQEGKFIRKNFRIIKKLYMNNF